MAQVYKSGAFLQQCWSVHPLCVGVKRMTDDRLLVLTCTSCRSTHHLTLSSVVAKTSVALSQPEEEGEPLPRVEGGLLQLAGCLKDHAAALSLREMDVFEDQALIRCAECRRHYQLGVTAFETHHK